MARIGSSGDDISTDDTTTDTETDTSGIESGIEQAVSDAAAVGRALRDDGAGTTTEPDSDRSDTSQETTDPTDVPARGRGDFASDPVSTTPDEPSVPDEPTEPDVPDFEQDETDQPARGRDTQETDTEPNVPDFQQDTDLTQTAQEFGQEAGQAAQTQERTFEPQGTEPTDTDSTEREPDTTQPGSNFNIQRTETLDTPFQELSETQQEEVAEEYAGQQVAFAPTGNGTRIFVGTQATQAAEGFLEQRQNRAVQSFIRETEGLEDRGDVVIQDGQIQLSEEGETAIEESVAADIRAEYGVPISTEDIIRTDEGFQLTGEARDEIQEQYREQQSAALIEGTTELQRQRLDRLDALADAQQVMRGRMLQGERERLETAREVSRGRMLEGARERAAESLESDIFGPFAAIEGAGIDASDITLTQTDGDGLRASLSEERQEEIESSYQESLLRDIEEQTGTELSRGDISIEETDGGYRATLSESGERKVEIEQTPGEDLPIIGGVTTTGTRIRRGIRSRTDPFAERWRDVTPSKEDVYGLVGATAPIAAAEPTPIGETGLAIIAGTGLGAAALQRRGNVLTGDAPTVDADTRVPTTTTTIGLGDTYGVDELVPSEPIQERTELDVGETGGAELPTPQRTATEDGELSVGDTDVPELSVPSQGQQTPQNVLDVSPVQTGQVREEEETIDDDIDREITEEDIITGLPEPDQPGPSTREQQRREDLTTPERTFPTGGGAVVGTGGATEEARERVEEAQEPFEEPAAELDFGQTVQQQLGQTPDVGFVAAQAEDQQAIQRAYQPLRPLQGQYQRGLVSQVQEAEQMQQQAPLELLAQQQQVAYDTTGLGIGVDTGYAVKEAYQYETTTPPADSQPPRRSVPAVPDIDAGEDAEQPFNLMGRVGTVGFDFYDPLTGQRLETDIE